MLRRSRYDIQVANAGISGDTLRGMLARLDLYVPQGTRIVIVQGGYNDVMAGSSATTLLASINGILSHLAARRVNTVLCGFYNRAWDAVGRVLARHYNAQFVDGSVCYDTRYRGWDGLHMTAAGHQVVAARMLPVIQGLLEQSTRNAAVPKSFRGSCRERQCYGTMKSTSVADCVMTGTGCGAAAVGARPRSDLDQ